MVLSVGVSWWVVVKSHSAHWSVIQAGLLLPRQQQRWRRERLYLSQYWASPSWRCSGRCCTTTPPSSTSEPSSSRSRFAVMHINPPNHVIRSRHALSAALQFALYSPAHILLIYAAILVRITCSSESTSRIDAVLGIVLVCALVSKTSEGLSLQD